MKEKKYWLLAALVMLICLALAACGGSRQKGTPTKEPAAPAEAAATEAAQPAAAAKPTEASKLTQAPAARPTEAPTPEEDTLSLDSRDAGLDKLTSYRIMWHAEWKSTEQGKTESGTWDWSEEYTADPKARHFSMNSPDSSDPAKINAFETWQIGDTTYMMSGSDQQCVSFSSEDAGKDTQQGLFTPSMLGRIQDARYVGKDTINGVPAKHYTYSSRASMLVGLGEINGETWVATDGGYVVKDTVSWKGGSGLFGLGGSSGMGEGSWTWELSDANKPVEIKPPEGCGGPQVDLPMMADAREKSRFGNMTTYKSDGKVAEVVAFYKDGLAADGWTLEGEPTEMGDIAMLNFTKDGQKLSVTISKGDDGTQVMLNVGE